MSRWWNTAWYVARNLPRDLAHLVKLAWGAAVYARTGKTPVAAYHSLRKLFCHTGGRSSDYLHSLVTLTAPRYSFPGESQVLEGFPMADVPRIVAQLRDVGYYVFPQRLPDALCDELTRVASTHPARLWPRNDGAPEQAVYDRRHPICEGYWLREQTLVESPAVQRLMADPCFLNLAQDYLGCRPVLDCINLWWSTTARISAQGRSAMAQLYHFDMERIKWLKFFVYLTDVTEQNGPHCFVARSHRRMDRPHELLRRGPVRIPDEDIRRHYPRESLLEFHGRRGTIIAEDTRGFHKGRPIEAGDRLMLEFDFCDSLFGGGYEQPELPADCDARLRQAMSNFPGVYAKFRIAPPAAEVVRRAA